MRATITVKRGGDETAEVFEFTSPATIGRFDAAVGPVDIDLGPLPEGAYVSRKHAQISFEEGTWLLADLGSSNGTFILRDDFEKIDSVELTDGAEFALGNARFVFRVIQDEEEGEPVETDGELTPSSEASSSQDEA